MATDTKSVAIEKGHFSGGRRLQEDPRRVGESNSKGLSQILRNFVDQLSERVQQGSDTIDENDANGVITVTLPTAMPDTSYVVMLTATSGFDDMQAGNVDVQNIFVTNKTATSFKVNVSPVNALAADKTITFDWLVVGKTQINTKK